MSAPNLSEENKKLCLDLMHSDTEDEVVAILKSSKLWDKKECWRYFGDIENNAGTIGQQSEAVAALSEKIINSIDARLVNACLEQKISPSSLSAPQNIREAVSRFFDSDSHSKQQSGLIFYWDQVKLSSESTQITVAATGQGSQANSPSISIADSGEGQTPDDFPNTLLSLHRSNKLRIKFVQGKFNMGGAGALRFSSTKHKFQMIVSRRNPELLENTASSRDNEWGFTIVRKEKADESMRSDFYTYLAPYKVDKDRDGHVLSFVADEMPIFPVVTSDYRRPYARMSTHGTLVKLYEYEWQGSRSNIVQTRLGLLRKLEVGLPELALPVRIYECRPKYRGTPGSFDTNLLGLYTRLQRDKADAVETSFPVRAAIEVGGSYAHVTAFALKPNKADSYRPAQQGVVFSVNGQTHASLSEDFFRRKSSGMSYLAKSLFIVVDCSQIERGLRDDLFTSTRDHLNQTRYSQELLRELGNFLKNNTELRKLGNRRREQALSDTLKDNQPLTNVIRSWLDRDQDLCRYLFYGKKISAPFAPANRVKNVRLGTINTRFYPTFFRFKVKSKTTTFDRKAYKSSRVRQIFETDAADDYFRRTMSPGKWTVYRKSNGYCEKFPVLNFEGPNSGEIILNFSIPDDVRPGDAFRLGISITDETRSAPLVNYLNLDVCAGKAPPGLPGPHNPRAYNSRKYELPPIVEITKEDYEKEAYKDMEFDDATALVIKNSKSQAYDFFINVDNKYLLDILKSSMANEKLLKTKFVYAMVLSGLALIRDRGLEDSNSQIETLVKDVTRALAPIILPMIETISGMDSDS